MSILCLYLACMFVKIEHTVDVIIMIFCKSASLMFMPAKYGASTKVKLAKYMLLSIETYLHARKIT